MADYHLDLEVPANTIVPEEGWLRAIASFAYLRYQNAMQSLTKSFFGVLKFIFMLITLPCYILIRPVLGRSEHAKFSHSGIIYFYALLSCTIVFNLWQQQEKGSNTSKPYLFLQYFEISCMGIAVLLMVYIDWSTRGGVVFENYEMYLILYFRTGLYVFGIASMGYSICNFINYITCVNGMNIVLNLTKALYIMGQILFLNRFYQAKLPGDMPLIKIALAHILATNLSLWIWTLCMEVYEASDELEECESYPINLGDTRKYFYPLFVEYLLLVASMTYEVWANMQVTELRPRGNFALPYHGSIEGEAFGDILAPMTDPNRQAVAGRRRKVVPNFAISLVLGLIFAAIFIAFVFASNDSGKHHQTQYDKFVIVNITLYSVQILVCYRVLFCRQSQLPNEERSSIDHDDALLYLGLAGILLWEGFHLYALILKTTPKTIELANGAMGIMEDIVQTVILVSIRRDRSTKDNNAKSISNCALFLLATNFALWCQNSFFIEEHLENPGENHKQFEKYLEVFANILNPLIIFFRFHSATCCYHVWSIFNHDN